MIGNAFHRLQRRRVADAARGWLVPGGYLALVWNNSPWDGDQEWQRVLARIVREWVATAGAEERVPADYLRHLAEMPHAAVLTEAGFAIVGEYDFPMPYEWNVERLTGFLHSTSVLSALALGEHVPAFEQDLRTRLLAVAPDDVLRETIDHSYTLARVP